ncbi:EAL domain-containing protein [Arcobacter sp. LA11]|uniref:EAL domain-containing protein n=1 Tax=Arcobacter sp. LA11 TaxID=1898176 RepID=UPI00093447DA|nr:EAL domain-containing protein [Arcobacter sp. LA11]
MDDIEIKAYQEQISNLNRLVVELQRDLYNQKQNIEILENDIIDLDNQMYKDYRFFFEQSPNILIILDQFGKIKNLNESALSFLSKKKYIILESSFRSFLDQIVFSEYTTQFRNFIKDEKRQSIMFYFLQLKNKTSFTLTLKKLHDKKTDQSRLIIGVIHPYDESDSQNSNYLSHIVIDQLKDGVIITNEKAEILKVNNAFTEITGYSTSEALGQTPRLLKSGRHSMDFYKKIWYDIEHHGWWSGEIWNKRKNGEVFPEWLQVNRVIEPVTKRIFFTSIFSDISERKKHQLELDRLAHYDTLTGLVNRHFLQISLSNLLEKSEKKNSKNGILFLDLDHFKQINDIYGHHEGDLLLQEAAQRILATVRTNDIVARVGGDEFIIVLSRIQSEEFVSKIGNSLVKELRKPFFINNNEHIIGASIGIAISPLHGTQIGELMSRADSAMYRAKKSGRNQVSVFRPEDEKFIKEKDTFKNILLKTINNPLKRKLEVYYQPIINIEDSSLYSLEALLRIEDENGNFVNPEEIISIAESEGLITELGEIIFEEICKFYSQNIKNNYKIVPIAINISILQLIKETFIESYNDIALKYDLDINNFNFEITETSAMENLENLQSTINNLCNLGSKIYLDDFGTGYASLSQLHNLPVNVVKIDKSFTFRIDEDQQARNMVKSMIYMAHGINCKVVIEGVETKKSFEWLKSIEADYVQGYYFSKPLKVEEIREKFLLK